MCDLVPKAFVPHMSCVSSLLRLSCTFFVNKIGVLKFIVQASMQAPVGSFQVPILDEVLQDHQDFTWLASTIKFCDMVDRGKARTWEKLLDGEVLYFREMLGAPRNPDGTYDLVGLSTCRNVVKTCDVVEAIKISKELCQDVVFRLVTPGSVKDVVVGRFVDGFAKIPAFNMLALHNTSIKLVLKEDVSVSVLAGQFVFDLRKSVAMFPREGRFIFDGGVVLVGDSRL